MTRTGFMGPAGTFSQEAALEYSFREGARELAEFGTIQELVCAVRDGKADEAVIPFENSLEGGVNATQDILAFEAGIMIKGELVISIVQNLLVKPGTRRPGIKRIISGPQPVGQCRKHLDANYPGIPIELVHSTSQAAKDVSEGRGDSAAIASAAAAGAYALEILERGIQDGENNRTRFIILSKQDSGRTGNDRTSIVFSTEDRPGSLYRILDIFNLWDVNMTRIESRPSKDRLGKYIFFVDIEGHRDDPDVRDALTMVQRKSSFYRFLGSYPQYVSTGRNTGNGAHSGI